MAAPTFSFSFHFLEKEKLVSFEQKAITIFALTLKKHNTTMTEMRTCWHPFSLSLSFSHSLFYSLSLSFTHPQRYGELHLN